MQTIITTSSILRSDLPPPVSQTAVSNRNQDTTPPPQAGIEIVQTDQPHTQNKHKKNNKRAHKNSPHSTYTCNCVLSALYSLRGAINSDSHTYSPSGKTSPVITSRIVYGYLYTKSARAISYCQYIFRTSVNKSDITTSPSKTKRVKNKRTKITRFRVRCPFQESSRPLVSFSDCQLMCVTCNQKDVASISET